MAINQLKAGAALSYVIIGLNSVVGLVYTPFMLRRLGQSEYGLYALAASVIAYLTVLDLGFGNAVVRYTAKFRAEGRVREQEEMFGMFLVLYGVISVVAFALGMVLYLNVDGLFSRSMTAAEVDKVRVMLMRLSFNLAFTFPMSIWGSIITAYENFVFQRVVSIARIVLNPLVMVVLLLYGYKAVAMVVVTTLFNVATLTVNWWYCRHRLGVRVRLGRFNGKFLREVTVYSFWIFLNAIMDRIYWSTGQFVLGVFRGAATVAVYAVAIQLLQMYYSFSTAISGVFLPKVTAMVAHGATNKEISRLFIRTGRVQYVVLSYIYFAFLLFGLPFVRLWAGAGYDGAFYVSAAFFTVTLVPLVQNLGLTILQARNQMKFRSLWIFGVSVGSLAVSIPASKYFGMAGCTTATALAVLVGHGIGLNIYYKRKQGLDIGRFWLEIGRMSVAPVLLLLAGLAVQHYVPVRGIPDFLLGVICYTAIFGVMSYAFVMNSEERGLFLQPLRKVFNYCTKTTRR